MRILLVLPGGVDASGETEVIPAVLWLIERLAKTHDVLVAALRQYEDVREYPLLGARVLNLGLPPVQTFGKIRQHRLKVLLKACREWKPEVIHALWLGENGELAALAASKLGTPLITSLGGGECTWIPELQYGGWGNFRSRRQTRRALRQAVAVTAGSRFALAELPRFGAWVPFGVDVERFKANIARPQGPPWRFLHVSDTSPIKNQSLLVNALRILKARGYKFHLDWIGTDTADHRLQRWVAESGLEQEVTLHGTMLNSELPKFYRQAHLLLQTSLHESQSVTLLEAAAAGVPTVGTPVGLLHDISPKAGAQTGSFFPEDFADAIETVLLDPEKRAFLARHAQQFSLSYSAEWTANQFESLYYNVVTNRYSASDTPYWVHVALRRGGSLHPGGTRASLLLLELASIQKGQRVIDFGCGSGLTTARLAERSDLQLKVLAIDNSPTMLDLAHRRLRMHGLRERVRLFSLVDTAKTTIKAASVDRILVESVMAFQAPETIREMLSLFSGWLKPGGRLILNERIWKKNTPPAMMDKANKLSMQLFQQPWCATNPADFEEWKALLTAFGLKFVSAQDIAGLILRSPSAEIYNSELEHELERSTDRLRTQVAGRIRFHLTDRHFRRSERLLAFAEQLTEARLIMVEKGLSA